MDSASPNPEAIRDAATFILVRNPGHNPSILLGRRRRNAVFMPNVFVFPGGAVDTGDDRVDLGGSLADRCRARLESEGERSPSGYAAAAIRELAEETGLFYGVAEDWVSRDPAWDMFETRRLRPVLDGISYVFRAITPPGNTRRFDARFFLASAEGIWGNLDDFSEASGELTELAWVSVEHLGALELSRPTAHALREIVQRLPDLGPPEVMTLRRA